MRLVRCIDMLDRGAGVDLDIANGVDGCVRLCGCCVDYV